MGEDKVRSEAFTWIIENYSMFNQERGKLLLSPEFKEEKYDGKRCTLSMVPKGWSVNDNSNKFFSHINGNDLKEEDKLTIDFKVEVLSAKFEIFHQFSSTNEIKGTDVRCHKLGEIDLQLIKEKLEEDNSDILIIRYYTSLLKKSIKAITHIGCSQSSFKWFVRAPNSTNWSETGKFFLLNRTHLQVMLTAPEKDILVSIKKSSYVMDQVVKCKISLVDVENIARYSKRDLYLFDSECDSVTWTFPGFFTKDLLKSKQISFLKNGFFTLIFNISISNGIDYEEIDNQVRYRTLYLKNDIKPSNVLFALQDELRNEFMSKNFTDVDIKFGEEVFSAHRLVLAARSALFKQIINDKKMKDNKIEICITDVESDIVKLLLNFMYTGELDDEMGYDNFLKLLVAATKYKIPSLIEMCCYYLTFKMRKENICEILDTADIIDNTFLKTAAFTYIVKNLKTILASTEWAELVSKNPNLAVEILPMFAN